MNHFTAHDYAEGGFEGVVGVLLRAGANRQAWDHEGRTALEAAHSGHQMDLSRPVGHRRSDSALVVHSREVCSAASRCVAVS